MLATAEKQALPTYYQQPMQTAPGTQAMPNYYQQQPMQTNPGMQVMQNYNQQPMQSGPRTFHVYNEGVFSNDFRILDSDKTTPLYSAEFHSWSKPHIEIRALSGPQAGGKATIGSATFHSFSSKIDMVVRGQMIEFTRNGSFSSGHQWRSPAFGGRTLKWKTDGAFTSDKICYVDDNKNNIIARWERSGMSMSKKGKIVILDPNLATPGNPAMEEVLVSAVIELEVTRRRTQRSANSGAAAAAGGGGGGGC